MCARALVVIPGLIRSMNRLEERVAIVTAELWNYQLMLFCSWVFFFGIILISKYLVKVWMVMEFWFLVCNHCRVFFILIG